MPVAIIRSPTPPQRYAGVRARAAYPVLTLPLTFAPSLTLAAPRQRRWVLVPMPGHCFEPGDDLARGLGVLRPSIPGVVRHRSTAYNLDMRITLATFLS